MSTRTFNASPDQRFELFDNEFGQVLHRKYRLRILWHLQDGPRRFGEIRKGLSNGANGAKGVAPRVLSRELKALVEVGLLRRKAYNIVPPRVEYCLTPMGRTLLPIISRLRDWGIRHLPSHSLFETRRRLPQPTKRYAHVARGRILFQAPPLARSRDATLPRRCKG